MKKGVYILSIFFIIVLRLNAQESSLLQREVHVGVEIKILKDLLTSMASQNIPLSYSNNRLPLQHNITLSPGQYQLSNILNNVFASLGISYSISQGQVLLFPQVKESQTFTVSGFIYSDLASREALPFANIRINEQGQRIQCNDFGFFSVNLPAGKYRLSISFVGFETKVVDIVVKADLRQDFALRRGLTLPSAVIRQHSTLPFYDDKGTGQTATEALPFAAGQADPLKLLQQKAGMSPLMFSVRGGSPDENLVLLDGVPLYHYHHFTGLISIFNNATVKRSDLYKGGFPARFEGRLSSVLDVKTKDGDMQKYHGEFDLSLINASMMLEGPIIKDRLSFALSARRSWIDGLTNFAIGDFLQYSLGDLNLKVNFAPNPDSRFYLSAYSGYDRLKLAFGVGIDPNVLKWKNHLLSLRWNKVWDKAFQTTTLSFSSFNTRLSNTDERGGFMFNRINDLNFDTQIKLSNTETWNTSIGTGLRISNFSSLTDVRHQQRAVELRTFVDNNWDITSALSLNTGLNYTLFMGPGKAYNSLQPRAVLNFIPGTHDAFHISFASMSQYYHQISSNFSALPTEFRQPSSATQEPQRSLSYEIGYHRRLGSGRILVQAFMKQYKEVLFYEIMAAHGDGNDYFDPARLFRTNGTSKGIEIESLLRFYKMEFMGAYTLSRNTYKSGELNQGKDFLSPYDLTNIVRLSLSWQATKNWLFSTMFNGSSGPLITQPSSPSESADEQYNSMLRPNNRRLEPSGTLSIGAARSRVKKNMHRTKLYLGINNLIGRPAPYVVSTDQAGKDFYLDETRAPRFFPYVGYTYTF